jgi:sulfonate transport system substrate-binding protein
MRSAAAVLEKNYNLKPSDYTAVPGNEGQLVRSDIDAASLRAVTVASVPDLKLQKPNSRDRSPASR